MSLPIALPWGLEFGSGNGLDMEYDVVGQVLSASITNESAIPRRPGTVGLRAETKLAAGGGSVWVPGDSMHAPAFIHRFGVPGPANPPGRATETATYRGGGVIVLSLPARTPGSLLLGTLTLDSVRTELLVELDRQETFVSSIDVRWSLEGLEIDPGETLALPPILVATGPDPWDLASDYASRVGAARGARTAGAAPDGWCSWYDLGRDLTAADVRRNVEAMKNAGFEGRLVQIDDGYQAAVGDWLQTAERFGAEMPDLAAEIREAGYRPGIWLAPLVLQETSDTLRVNPELALANPAGDTFLLDTWLGRCAVLDVTKGPARDWLSSIVETVVREWGFDYLKLDALQFAAQPSDRASYSQPGTTGLAHLRRALTVIRRASGQEATLVGCSSQFGPAVGLVDVMRVGPDVAPIWERAGAPCLRAAVASTLHRGWMNGLWWTNDPDCLLARTAPGGLTGEEVRFLATAIALSGGSVMAGDDLSRLGRGGIELGQTLIPATGRAARPVDPTEAPVPSVWRVTLGTDRGLLGILNWTDEPRWVAPSELLRPGEMAFDVWRGEALGKGDLLLAAHEGSLWQTAMPAETPRAVGDTGHVAFAALFERRVSGRLQLRNDSSRYRMVAVEARGQVREAELAPGEMRWFD